MRRWFKTPGSSQQAPLIAGDNNQVMIMTPERQDELIRIRRETLEAMQIAQMSYLPDSGNSPASIQ